MNYEECLAYLEQLGNEVLTMKLGLENIQRLLSELRDPQLEYPCVLIAGTNGKGSVARFLSSIASHGGLRTGLYTSPHLIEVRERIAVDNLFVSREDFARSFSSVAEAVERIGNQHHPTYFETLTATAFLHFAHRAVDFGVFEVGLGGRLDSTNVVDPSLSIITPISRDHTHVLGTRLELIAAEKAGIIHPGRPLVTSPQRPSVRQVLQRVCRRRNALFHQLDPSEIEEIRPDGGNYGFRFRGVTHQLRVKGAHQVDNAALALLAAELLKSRGLKIAESGFAAGPSACQPYAALRKLGDNPAIFIDGAHNAEAAARLREFIEQHTGKPRALVFGIMRDKEIRQVLRNLLPAFERIYLTRVQSKRAADLVMLKRLCPQGQIEENPMEAFEKARREAATVVVTGSFYLAGEIAEAIGDG